MTARKLPDGGILFDEEPAEDEDDSVVSGESSTPDLPVDWNEGSAIDNSLRGQALIGEFVKRLPNGPGVYRMLNEVGDVLYVGKARSLKKRVSNYAQGCFHSNRIGRKVR